MIPLVPGTHLESVPGVENRESRQFWAITDQQSVQRVTGYECPQKGLWWVPELNYSMWEGKTLFVEEADGLERLMGLLNDQEQAVVQQINEIGSRLRKLRR